MEELLQVFDKNKNMINESIPRSLKKTLKDGKHFMIVLLFIENNDKFLMQKVAQEKGSEIATTGGHATFMDDSITTVKKEAKEEINIEFSNDELILVDSIDCGNCFCEIYYSTKEIDISNIKIQEEEVEKVFWLSKEEIFELIKQNKLRKSNIESFNKILEYKDNLNVK